MRRRETIEVLLPILGIVLIFAAILIPPLNETMIRQVIVVLAGLLVLETGVWHMASPFLPEDRRHHRLRAEVDHFIAQVRELNRVALRDPEGDGHPPGREELLAEMHETVERIGALAGGDGAGPIREGAGEERTRS